MKVIINADDLGLSIEVNEAIENAIIKKRISSCTTLANGAAFEDAVRISKLYSDISFGVHLNITEFCPLTNHVVFKKYNFIDDTGNFIEGAAFATKNYTAELKNSIFEEWLAQINKIRNAGINISHLDSHQHAHGIYDLEDVLEKVIRVSGIAKIRRKAHTSMLSMILNRNNKYKSILDKSCAVKLPKQKFIIRRLIQLQNSVRHHFWIKKFRKSTIMTQGFMAYGSYIFLLSKYYKWCHFDTIELMCHPGHKGYANETKIVMAEELRNLMQYQLISYNDL